MNSSSTSASFVVLVQEVFALRGSGTVVTGQVTAGTVDAGVGGFLVREGGFAKPVRILQIQVSGERVPEASVGALVGLLLQGVDKSEVKRGDRVQSSPSKADV
jgi:selenocysteine-specific translation elongation factor